MTMLEDFKTPLCPTCNMPPAYIMDGGHQAWCSNEFGCNILTWDMFLTADELRADAATVELPPEVTP